MMGLFLGTLTQTHSDKESEPESMKKRKLALEEGCTYVVDEKELSLTCHEWDSGSGFRLFLSRLIFHRMVGMAERTYKLRLVATVEREGGNAACLLKMYLQIHRYRGS